MAGLPEGLEALDLFVAKGFLLYALGYRDELRNEGFTIERWSDDDIDEFMRMAYGQPGRLQMSERPQIEVGSHVNYRSVVLGCRINVDAPATIEGISTAEAVLATIESFFATSLGERVLPYRSQATIRVEAVKHLTEGLTVSRDDSGDEPFLLVQYESSTQPATSEARKKFRDGLMMLVPHFIMHIAVVEDPDLYMKRIAGEERGFARALIYAESSLTQENVFGPDAKVRVSDWLAKENARQFPLQREQEWSHGVEITQLPLEAKDAARPGSPDELRSFFEEKLHKQTHSERKINSPIDIPLWDEAKWKAVFYFSDPSRVPLPVFCLGFADRSAAEKIFKGLRKQFGEHDVNDSIRVVIIKGIQRHHPAAYRVFIAGNIKDTTNSVVVSVGRHQTMTPATSENVDRFLESISEGSSYLLAPAHFVSADKFPTLGMGLAIQKDAVVVRQAWEIGRNDIDSGAILLDDDPLIPDGVDNPPVAELLKLKREFKKQGR